MHTIKTLKLIRRILLPLIGFTVFGSLVVLILPLWRRNNDVFLPSPGGPYPVGRIEYDWTDTSRADPLGRNPQQPRKLNVWIWYPGERSPSPTIPAPYLPTAWIVAREHQAGIGKLLMQNLAHVYGNSTEQLPLATDGARYPVLIMQPGLGPILADYTVLCETLASYGYIVVGSTPTESANVVVFNDGETVYRTPQGNLPETASIPSTQKILGSLIQVWAEDDRFVLNQVEALNAADPAGRFTGHIDLNAVGVIGHSFGGATAAQFCRLDTRCKAGVDLDGYLYGDVVQAGLHQPFMFLWSATRNPNDAAWQKAMQEADRIFQQLPAGSMRATIQGTRHFNFADYAVEYEPALRLLGGLGPIDGAYGLRIITTYVQAFFDLTLRHHSEPILDATTSPFPEVQIERR